MKNFDQAKLIESAVGGFQWMNSVEAAEYLRISVGSLRNHVSKGELPYYKFRRNLRFKRTDLDRLIEQTRYGGWRIK